MNLMKTDPRASTISTVLTIKQVLNSTFKHSRVTSFDHLDDRLARTETDY